MKVWGRANAARESSTPRAEAFLCRAVTELSPVDRFTSMSAVCAAGAICQSRAFILVNCEIQLGNRI